MALKNPGMEKVKNSTDDNFTTDFGIKARRRFNRILRFIFKLATKRELIIDYYPELEKDTPYIFASTHSFDEDIIACLAAIDRNAYVLMGTTDQIDYNPQIYMAYLNGMIYVDRLNDESRKMSVKKMQRILNSGTSVLLYPEGGYNNTENLLVMKLFAGPYILAQKTGAKVVPISTYNEPDTDKIFIKVGSPIDMKDMEKKEALDLLRDAMATMTYESMEEHSSVLRRDQLEGDIHLGFMESRRKNYLKVKWHSDVWDEELTQYKDKSFVEASDVRKSIDQMELTPDEIEILGPVLKRRYEDQLYDFKSYMKKNWDKK